MGLKIWRDIILILLILGVLSYFAYTTNIQFIQVFAIIMWTLSLIPFSSWMFQVSTGFSPSKTITRWKYLKLWTISGIITAVINYFILFYFFKNEFNPYLIVLLGIYAGIFMSMRDLRFALLQTRGANGTTSQEIKSILVIELWFILLLGALKFAQILCNKP